MSSVTQIMSVLLSELSTRKVEVITKVNKAVASIKSRSVVLGYPSQLDTDACVVPAFSDASRRNRSDGAS